MAKLPAEVASDEPVVTMVPLEPLVLSALDEIENTGPLRVLVVVMAVVVNVDTP